MIRLQIHRTWAWLWDDHWTPKASKLVMTSTSIVTLMLDPLLPASNGNEMWVCFFFISSPFFFQIFEYPIERKKEEEEENVFDDFVRIRFNRASNLYTTCRPTLSSPIRASFYRTSVVTWPEIFRAPPPTSREMPRAIRSHWTSNVSALSHLRADWHDVI